MVFDDSEFFYNASHQAKHYFLFNFTKIRRVVMEGQRLADLYSLSLF